jgi:xanthine/uracil/vitamin C permease (AzgA family)
MSQSSETQAPTEPSGVAGTIDRYFGLTAADTTLPTEFRAGLATFLTMAYIMFVNPAILDKRAWIMAPCSSLRLINAIPLNLKLGIGAGIGLFLALIGLLGASRRVLRDVPKS